MITRLLGWGLVLLAIVSIVGSIGNSKQFGTKLLNRKMGLYVVVLLLGLYFALF